MEEARKKREEAQKEYDAELEKIMTPEQFKQYQEDQKNRRQRGGGGFGGGFGGGQRGPRPQNM
jgi:Spy/CpxP family protein refolding chaperone